MHTQKAKTFMLPRWLTRCLYYTIALGRCSTDSYVWGLLKTVLSSGSTQAARRSCLTRIRDRLHFSMRNTGYFYRSWLTPHLTPNANKSDVIVIVHSTNIDLTRIAINNLLTQVEQSQNIWVLVDDRLADFTTLLRDRKVRVISKSKPLDLEQPAQEYLYVTRDDFHTHSGSIFKLREHAVQYGADLAYGDEDQLMGGRRCKPIFKPDVDPILLETRDYIGPNFLARLDLIKNCPGLLESKALLICNNGISVAHLPLPIVSQIAPPLQPLNFTVAKSDSDRRFSFIIPTRDQPLLLSNLARQLLELGNDSRVKLTILNNSDPHSETQTVLTELENNHANVAVINLAGPFNWSRFNNKAVTDRDSDILVFLNDDMTLLDPNLLARLNFNFDNPQVGIVGALLTFPSGYIQHAGIVLGMGGFADHIYRDCPSNDRDYHPFVSPNLRRTVSAVTGAFFAIRRDLFEGLGGFNEDLRHSGDVELCVRATKKGYRTVFDPSIKFTHHESQTRGSDNLDDIEKKNLADLVPVNDRDTYYNSNLSLRSRYPTLQK